MEELTFALRGTSDRYFMHPMVFNNINDEPAHPDSQGLLLWHQTLGSRADSAGLLFVNRSAESSIYMRDPDPD